MSGVVVAAHPDDEILWLSSVLAQADKIVLCFGAPYGNPKMAASRQRAVAALGLANLADLAIPEAGVRKLVDWAEPMLTATGMAIAEAEGQSRYDANFGPLLERMRPLLAGATDVYTHNPWGEYGHPEHVQVHRAVARLQTELGFTLWFSNYVAPLSLPLARQIGVRPCWAEQRLMRPDIELAKRLRRIYLRHGAWTFSRLHRWPAAETFYAQTAGERQNWRALHGETLLDVTAMRWWKCEHAASRRLF